MLKKINDDDLNNLEKIHLYYGIHKAYEDIKDYKNAFKFLKIGNELLKKKQNIILVKMKKKLKKISIFIKKLKKLKLLET